MHTRPKTPRNACTPKKASRTEQNGTSYHRGVAAAGGEKFIAATKILDGIPQAVRPDSRESVKINALIRNAEASALREFAVKNQLLLDGEEFENRWKAQGEMGGSENDITYDETTGLVWKRNRVDVMHVSWRQFFHRMLLHNIYFPEAPLRLEGFVDSNSGLCPVFTQPDVHAVRGATRQEVSAAMETRGYTRTRYDDYQSPLLLVEDLHDGNVLFDSDGQLHVIDPVIFINHRRP
jgi:hypothetical protein